MSDKLPDPAGKETLVAENELCRFYQNDWTRSAVKYAASREILGLAILIAEQKSDGCRSYILIDTKTREILGDDQSYEGICCRMDMVGIDRKLP